MVERRNDGTGRSEERQIEGQRIGGAAEQRSAEDAGCCFAAADIERLTCRCGRRLRQRHAPVVDGWRTNDTARRYPAKTEHFENVTILTSAMDAK